MTRREIDEETLSNLDELLHVLYKLKQQLKTAEVNIQEFSELSLTDGETASSSSLQVDNYFEHYKSLLHLLSKECTTLCLMFSQLPLPSPDESSALTQKLVGVISSLAAHVYIFPRQHGHLCWCAVQKSTLAVVDGLVTLAASVKSSPQHAKNMIKSTGAIWEEIEKALSSLPTDNRAALLQRIDSVSALVLDALTELKQEQTECQDDAHAHYFAPCLAMVRATKATLAKLRECVHSDEATLTAEQVKCYDRFGLLLKCISPAIDNLACALYEGPNTTVVRVEAVSLQQKVVPILKLMITINDSADAQLTQRADFLQSVFDHNLTKLPVTD